MHDIPGDRRARKKKEGEGGGVKEPGPSQLAQPTSGTMTPVGTCNWKTWGRYAARTMARKNIPLCVPSYTLHIHIYAYIYIAYISLYSVCCVGCWARRLKVVHCSTPQFSLYLYYLHTAILECYSEIADCKKKTDQRYVGESRFHSHSGIDLEWNRMEPQDCSENSWG